jgi:hypothetical protein
MNIQSQRPAAAKHLAILALALSTMVVSSGAQAQASAVRYAYKELPKPTAAAYCGAPFFINNNGEAAGTCSYQNGYTTVPDYSKCSFDGPLAALCTALFRKRVPVYYSWPVQWSANAAPRMLTLPGTQNKNKAVLIGLTDAGEVYATNYIVVKPGSASANTTYQVWSWKGQATAGALFSPPASVSGGASYELWQVTRGGRMLWVMGRAGVPTLQLFVSTPTGATQAVPDLPASSAQSVTDRGALVNDQGHVLRARVVSSFVDATTNVAEREFWLERGQGWERLPIQSSTPGFIGNAELAGLSNQDTVVVRFYSDVYTWRSASPQAASVELNQGLVSDLNDSDVLVGTTSLNVPNGKINTHGVVVAAGARQDLNDLSAGIPAGWVIMRALSVNNKGQIVVELGDASKSTLDYKTFKYAVLTPQ